MKSSKSRITQSEIDRFVRMAKRSDPANEIITGSGENKNVSLMKKGRTVSWLFRYKGLTVTFGYSHPDGEHMIKNVSEAEFLVPLLRKEFGIGGEHAVNKFINTYHERKSNDLPLEYDEIKKSIRQPVTTWTLQDCVKRTLDDRIKETQKKPISAPHASDMWVTFNRPELEKMMKMKAAHLQRADIEKVRDEVYSNRGLNPARKFITHTRSVLDFCFSEHAGLSGLESSDRWWLLLTFNEQSLPRERTPTLQEIARTMLLAEHFSKHPAPKSKIRRMAFGKEVLNAFFFVCLTAQRQGAAVQLRCENMSEIDDGKLAVWKWGSMKSRKQFALPVPQSVVDFVEPLKHLHNREFVLNSYLEQETPVSRHAIYGIVKKLKKLGVLEKNEIQFFTPHDIRRTLVSVLDDAGLPAGASAILDHSMSGSNVDERQRAAKITSKSYFQLQRIPLKKEAMQIWTDALLGEVERQRKEWEPVL